MSEIPRSRSTEYPPQQENQPPSIRDPRERIRRALNLGPTTSSGAILPPRNVAQPDAKLEDVLAEAVPFEIASTSPPVEIPFTPQKVEESSLMETVESDVVSRSERALESKEKQTFEQWELGRLDRNLRLGESLESLERGKPLERREVREVAGALESRGWYNLFSKLQSGDDLITLLVPSGKGEGIKHMNDVLFGAQRTDQIIDRLRLLTSSRLRKIGVSQIASTYKNGYARRPEDLSREEGAMEKLEQAVEDIRTEMTTFLVEESLNAMEDADVDRSQALTVFLRHLLGPSGAEVALVQRGMIRAAQQVYERALQEEAAAWQIAIAEEDPESTRAGFALQIARGRKQAAEAQMGDIQKRIREDIVAPALEDPRRGYRVTFGIAHVDAPESEGSYVHIERAVCQSVAGATEAREGGSFGVVWSPEIANECLAERRELQAQLEEKYLIDDQGRAYPLFGKRGDGFAELNADVIRGLRKGSLKPRADQEDIAASVNRYLRVLNVLDVIKPYTYDEVAGGTAHGGDRTLAEQVAWTKEQAFALRSGKGLDSDTRASIVQELHKDGKDQACTSSVEFHRQALEMPSCTYVSLDVRDVGVELLQEFEILLQRVDRGDMTFDQAQLVAGDATTQRMRDFRSRVSEIYREKTGETQPVMLVGGDEVVLAVDGIKATDELMLALQSIQVAKKPGSSVRVVQTVVAESDRVSRTSDRDEMKREHLKAKHLAETGATVAKDIEGKLHDVEVLISALPQEERAEHIASMQALHLEQFAVRQVQGKESFELVIRDANQPSRISHESHEVALQRIEVLRALVQDRVTALQDELRKTPGVTDQNVSQALYRKHRLSPEGFQAWLQTQSV